ncbi:hypothetical protein BC834DRAFT_884307 [Gloeopeniophorella convolvens]|nr:hypothetical protein BC834DRAFT_884307 [Gloeopeniophorella convolvens]
MVNVVTSLALAFASLFISSVAAQAQGVPACAQACAQQAASAANCSLTDTTCICTNPQFAAAGGVCLGASCTPADLQAAQNFFLSLCGVGTTSSSSSSGSSATVTSSSSSGSGASTTSASSSSSGSATTTSSALSSTSPGSTSSSTSSSSSSSSSSSRSSSSSSVASVASPTQPSATPTGNHAVAMHGARAAAALGGAGFVAAFAAAVW